MNPRLSRGRAPGSPLPPRVGRAPRAGLAGGSDATWLEEVLGATAQNVFPGVVPECPDGAVLEAGGTSSRGRTAHLLISRGRWLNSVTPGARFGLALSESSCLERGSASSVFGGRCSEWGRLGFLPLGDQGCSGFAGGKAGDALRAWPRPCGEAVGRAGDMERSGF